MWIGSWAPLSYLPFPRDVVEAFRSDQIRHHLLPSEREIAILARRLRTPREAAASDRAANRRGVCCCPPASECWAISQRTCGGSRALEGYLRSSRRPSSGSARRGFS